MATHVLGMNQQGIKTGPTQSAGNQQPRTSVDLIPQPPLIETQGEHCWRVAHRQSFNECVFRGRSHNFDLDMNWLPASVIPRRQWPAIHYKEKRAITFEGTPKNYRRGVNLEGKSPLPVCWHPRVQSQGDIANLKGEDVDWENHTVSFFARKPACLFSSIWARKP